MIEAIRKIDERLALRERQLKNPFNIEKTIGEAEKGATLNVCCRPTQGIRKN